MSSFQGAEFNPLLDVLCNTGSSFCGLGVWVLHSWAPLGKAAVGESSHLDLELCGGGGLCLGVTLVID